MLRKIIISTFLCASILPIHAYAVSNDNVTRGILNRLDTIGEHTYDDDAFGNADRDLRVRILYIVRIALSFVGIIAVTLIAYGGFMYMTARGNDDQVDSARTTIYRSLVGLIIITVSYALTSLVTNVIVKIINT